MSINNKKNTRRTTDIFDDDFEVIYEGELPDISIDDDDDDYRDVLSGLSDIDHTDYIRKNDYDKLTAKLNARKNNKKYDHYYNDDDYDDYDDDDDDYDDYDDDDDDDYYDNRRNRRNKKKKDDNKEKSSKKKKRGNVKVPNLAKPVAKTAKTGGKFILKTINLLLRIGTMLLIAAIIYLLGTHFISNIGSFDSIVSSMTAANQPLIAYLAVAAVLLLYEIITFFCVLGGKKYNRKGDKIDTGRGLVSCIIIGAGTYCSALFYSLIPQSPSALQGVASALQVFGSLKETLLPICVAGVISCIIRKFVIR